MGKVLCVSMLELGQNGTDKDSVRFERIVNIGL